MNMREPKRITLFAGHYGSGKTNLAVNYALWLRKSHAPVAVVDLDIVNPYFRSKDSEDILSRKDISLISSAYANTNVDVPAMTPEANRVFDERDLWSVIDVGGDDRGAYALGRYARRLELEPSCDVLLVVNQYRPLTEEIDDAETIMREIEQAGHTAFTGIVNNSNLGAETTAETVLRSLDYADKLAARTGLPLAFTSVREDLVPALEGKVESLFPIVIMKKPGWNL